MSTAAGPVPRVVPLRWWHLDAVVPVEADLFGAERWSAGMFWNELAAGNFYVAAVRSPAGPDGPEELVGYAGLAVQPPDEAWVQTIAVRRDHQRAGVGRELLTALLAEAARRGCRQTLLEVAVDNAPAQRLYQDFGFVEVGLRRGYYQPSNTDALVMSRRMEEEVA